MLRVVYCTANGKKGYCIRAVCPLWKERILNVLSCVKPVARRDTEYPELCEASVKKQY
jgi:hypothetical protein